APSLSEIEPTATSSVTSVLLSPVVWSHATAACPFGLEVTSTGPPGPLPNLPAVVVAGADQPPPGFVVTRNVRAPTFPSSGTSSSLMNAATAAPPASVATTGFEQ